MGLGPFSSDSASSQETVSVGGSGQYIKKGTVAQGGSVQVGKSANVGGLNTKGNKGSITVNNGLSKSDFGTLISGLSSATPAEIQKATPVSVTPATPAADDTKQKYLTYGLWIAGAVALGIAARSFLKKS